MTWYLEVWKKFAVFSGRARRKEYWYFTLVNLIVFVAFMALGEQANVVAGIYMLAVLLPSLAVSVRRLHDTGRSGWWVLLALVPLLNLVLLVFFVQDSVEGANEYGANPKTP